MSTSKPNARAQNRKLVLVLVLRSKGRNNARLLLVLEVISDYWSALDSRFGSKDGNFERNNYIIPLPSPLEIPGIVEKKSVYKDTSQVKALMFVFF